MIKTAMVAMTLLGCDCDAKVCEFISETPAQWSNVAECESAIKSRVVRNSDLQYPLVSGTCRVVRDAPPLVAATAPIPSPAASPAAVAPERSAVYAAISEGSRLIFRKTAGGYAAVNSGVSQAADSALGWVRRSAGLVLASN